jgi:2-polyprenyl-3-methyl-5-hydroxy-6-metoxy-1,4-benzoquinol methylase
MVADVAPATAKDAFTSPVVVYLAVGVLVIALFHKRWPAQFDAFTKGSLKGAAFIAGFWPLALLWLGVLEARHGIFGKPEPAWPGVQISHVKVPRRRDESPPADKTTDAELDEIMRRLSPPKDLRDGSAWDEYWKHQLNSGFAWLSDMMFSNEDLVAQKRERGHKTVLLAGNGVSIEPRAMAHAGFQVTVMDLSPLAIKVAQEIEPPTEPLEQMVGKGAARSGGSAEFVVGDVFDSAVCPGPYDVIIERRTAQGYVEGDLDGFMSALVARLSPNGLFVSHCHDGSWNPKRERRHWTEPWFKANGWPTVNGASGHVPRTGRTAWLVISTG